MILPDSQNSRRRDWAGVSLIVAIALGVLYPLWLHDGVAYSKHSDVIAEHLSVKSVGLRAMLEEKRSPLWNPSMNSGAPALANPQSMYFFPFDLLYLVLPLDRAVNVVMLLNVVLAGATMYLLAGRIFDDRRAAFLCAIAYMLSYRYMAMIYAGWTPKMSMFALTPLAFWACLRAFDRPDARGVIRTALVAALVCLQGDMQQLYYTGLGCLLFSLTSLPGSVRDQRGKTVAVLLGGGVLGAMLASPTLLPQWEYASLSTRTTPDYAFFIHNAPQAGDLATLIDPNQRCGERDEFWENNFYFGLWLTPLIAAAFTRERKQAFMLLIAASTAAFLCFDTVVLKTLFDYLPGFSLFRQSSRLLLLAQFVLVLLAGAGAAHLLRQDVKTRPRVFAIASLATASIAVWLFDDAPLLITCGLMSAAGVLAFARPQAKLALACLICMAPILDAGLRAGSMIDTKPLENALPHRQVHELLNRDACGGRVLVTSRTVIPYGAAGYYGIDLVNGYASLNLKHYIEYFSVMQFGSIDATPKHPVVWTDCRGIAKPHLLRALDVKYIAADSSTPFERIGFEHVADFDDTPVFVFYKGLERRLISLWRDRLPLGPAYFAASVSRVQDEAESLNALATSRSALHADVMGLTRDIDRLDYAGGKVEQTRRGFNRYVYSIDSRGQNYLILSQVWHPSWRGRLDGGPIDIQRANHALIGCVIPPGRHELVLEMTSPLMNTGIWLACVSLAFMTTLLAAHFRKQVRSHAPNKPPSR